MLVLRLLIVLLVVDFIGLQGCNDKPVDRNPPNIIIIFTDDQGYNDVGCFGSPDIKTPHIDQLAKEGAKFTQFYAAQPICSASRAALLTGCYPNRIGINGALMPNSSIGLNHEEVTIAEILKAKGYATAIYGKWHLGDHEDYLPLHHGFDEYYGIPYSNDMWPQHPLQGNVFNFPPLPLIENNQVIDTLEDQSNLTADLTRKSVDFIKRNQDRPFFLYIPHPQPHVPLFVSEKFRGKSARGLYGDVIMEIDWSVGQIVKAVEAHGLEDNTLIIFTSDNGPWLAYGNHAGSAYPLREGKATTWEGGQREPFVMRYPPLVKPGSVINTPVMAIDILPTIAEIVKTDLPDKKIDGRSIVRIMTVEQDNMVHHAYYYYYRNNELQAIRSGDWKLYFPHSYGTMEGQPQGRDGLPGSYATIEMDKPELYNVVVDSREENNVYDDHPDVVAQLEGYADKARIELGDKLTNSIGNAMREPGKMR